MNALGRFALNFLFTAWLAISFGTPIARADDWDNYRPILQPLVEPSETQPTDRHSTLEQYWQQQREARQALAERSGHAWYGNFGPYYGGRVQPIKRTYGPQEYFASALQSDCYDYSSCYSRFDHCYGADLGCHRNLDCHRDYCDYHEYCGPSAIELIRNFGR